MNKIIYQDYKICTRCKKQSPEKAALCNYCFKLGSFYFGVGFVLSLMHCLLQNEEKVQSVIGAIGMIAGFAYIINYYYFYASSLYDVRVE